MQEVARIGSRRVPLPPGWQGGNFLCNFAIHFGFFCPWAELKTEQVPYQKETNSYELLDQTDTVTRAGL